MCWYAVLPNSWKEQTQIFEQDGISVAVWITVTQSALCNYKVDIYFTEPFVALFAWTENDIELEFINEDHHVFEHACILVVGNF